VQNTDGISCSQFPPLPQGAMEKVDGLQVF
jgi:hypothetical protein